MNTANVVPKKTHIKVKECGIEALIVMTGLDYGLFNMHDSLSELTYYALPLENKLSIPLELIRDEFEIV